MNGLLHRLARQVVGPPPLRVQAMARLPFFAPPELKSDDASGLDLAAEAATPNRAPGSDPLEHDKSGDPAAQAALLPMPPPRMAAGLDASSDASPARTRLHGHDALGPARGPAQGAQSEALSKAGQPPAMTTGAHAQAPTLRVSVQPPPQSGAASGERVDQGVATIEIITDSHISASGPERYPPPLLARAEPAAPPAGRAPAAPTGVADLRPKTPSPDAPDEVHVHIGRIEVTAVQETPPKRAARSRPPPVSLDEYLAWRQRESS